MTPQSEYNADIEARKAIGTLQATMKRHPRGRIVLELHMLGGLCCHFRLRKTDMTEEDVRRVMESKPVGTTL